MNVTSIRSLGSDIRGYFDFLIPNLTFARVRKPGVIGIAAELNKHLRDVVSSDFDKLHADLNGLPRANRFLCFIAEVQDVVARISVCHSVPTNSPLGAANLSCSGLLHGLLRSLSGVLVFGGGGGIGSILRRGIFAQAWDRDMISATSAVTDV